MAAATDCPITGALRSQGLMGLSLQLISHQWFGSAQPLTRQVQSN